MSIIIIILLASHVLSLWRWIFEDVWHLWMEHNGAKSIWTYLRLEINFGTCDHVSKNPNTNCAYSLGILHVCGVCSSWHCAWLYISQKIAHLCACLICLSMFCSTIRSTSTQSVRERGRRSLGGYLFTCWIARANKYPACHFTFNFRCSHDIKTYWILKYT